MREADDEETLFDQETLLQSGTVKVTGPSFWCRKFTKTIVLSVAFFALGLCIAIPGPTLLALSERVNTDVEHISLIFTARSVGYLVGSIIGGFLFDHFDQQILLFYSLLLTAVATTVAPWCTSLVVLAIMISFQGLTMGVLDTGGNVFCIKIWGRQSGPYMQVVHFAFGIGAFVAPLLARPFLISQDSLRLNSTGTQSPGVAILGRIPHPSHLVWSDSENPHYRYLRALDMESSLNNSVTDLPENLTSSLVPFKGDNSSHEVNTATLFLGLTSTMSSTSSGPKPKKPHISDSTNFDAEVADGTNLKDVHEGEGQNKENTKAPRPTATITTQSSSAQVNESLITDGGNKTNITQATVQTALTDNLISVTTYNNTSITTPTTTPTTTTPTTTTPTTTTPTTTTPTTTTPTTTTTTISNGPTTITGVTTEGGISLLPSSDDYNLSSTMINNGSSLPTVTTTTVKPNKPEFVDLVHDALDSLSKMSKIQFAYMIIGLLLLVNSVMFLVLYCKDRNRASVFSRDEDHDSSYGKESKGYRITMLVILFFFFFVYVGMEVTFGGLLSTFAVEDKNWSQPKSAVLTSIFWGSLAAGRGCAIFVARFFKPPCMLITDLVLVLIGSVILCFGVGKVPYVLWGGTLVIGFGMSSIFPTGVSWADEYFPLSGKSTAVFVVGSALGEMVIPVLTGYLYEQHHRTFLYVMFASSIVLAVIYVVMQCFASSRPKILSSALNGFVPLRDDDNIPMEDLDQNFEGSGLLETSRRRGPRKHPKPANMELEYSRLVEIDD